MGSHITIEDRGELHVTLNWFRRKLRRLKREKCPDEQISDWIGEEREQRVKAVLETMKQERTIVDFLKTKKLDSNDRRGTDFIIIAIVRGRRQSIELSVTGPDWVVEHHTKHPKKPIIAVDLNCSQKRVERAIKQGIIQIIDGLKK